jgi:DNA-binding response OmpR family regulator
MSHTEHAASPVLAIQFALEMGDQLAALTFLRDWTDGAFADWPEYAAWLETKCARKELIVDHESRTVTVARSGAAIHLAPVRLKFLELLCQRWPKVVSHALIWDTLYALVGEAAEPGANVVKVHVHQMRAVLKPYGIGIRCEWGVGYALEYFEARQ